MAYKHGVYGSEVPTSLVPMTELNAGLPVVFGTAPVHLAANPVKADEPVLCYTYKEAVQALGYSDNWADFTLCEFMYSEFQLYNIAPVVFVNVLDPAKHKTAVAMKAIDIVDGAAYVADPVILGTLTVAKATAGQPLVKGTDYTLAHDDAGGLIITVLADGQLKGATQMYVAYDKVDASKVQASDIIGGIDTTTGAAKGLELVGEIYARFRLVPGLIVAPGWSDKPGVASVMDAKVQEMGGHFNACAIIDVPADSVTKYTDVAAYKNDKSLTTTDMFVCWPMLTNGGKLYHYSTHLAGVCGQTDATTDDIPFKSPSNKTLKADGCALADGTPVFLNSEQATYLNGQGIVTVLNFIGGWKVWGNRTGAYPGVTDVKDSFISIRRMFNWLNNTLITTFWQKIDDPTNPQLVKTVLDSANIYLNGLTSRGIILGGRVEFRSDDNTTTELMDGKIRFHVYFTPPSPAREIDFIQEYDPDYIKTLFE